MVDKDKVSDKNLSHNPTSSSSKKYVGYTGDTTSKMLTVDEHIELGEKFKDNLKSQADMIKRLRDLKASKDLNYYLDKKGALDIGVPSSLSDEEAGKIAKEVGIIDRILNTKMAEFKELEGKDFVSNGNQVNEAYVPLVRATKERYNDLFDKE